MTEHIHDLLNFEQVGKHGPPMVFVHPNPFDHTSWLYQMAHFQTWFRCIGIDLPGYGRSPTASAGLTMPEIARACWEAVDRVSDEPAVLVGLSVGATVVRHMVNLRPEHSRALIISGSGYRPVKTFAFERIQHYTERGIDYRRTYAFEDYSPAFGETPLGRYFVEMFVERNRWADVPTIVEMFRALAEPDPDELIEQVPCPMLIITGSEDKTHAASLALHARIPGCELAVIEGAGHACNMEQPWAWDAHALRFLRKHGLVDDEAPDAANHVPGQG